MGRFHLWREKEFALDERSKQVVRQTTVALPFLDEQVPALFAADGQLYIPVFAVCRVLVGHAAINLAIKQ